MPEVWLCQTDIVQELKTSMFYLPSLRAALILLVFESPVKRRNEHLTDLNTPERRIFVNFK